MLGAPVAHSRSPAIHNGLFQARDLCSQYLALELDQGDLKSVLKALHRLPFHGFNLTYPLKEEGAACATALSPEAEELQAVNTLVRTPQGWTGHSTDGDGLLLWMHKHLKQNLQDTKIVLLGAGGAARSAALALQKEPIEWLKVVTRSRHRFETNFFQKLRSDPRMDCLLTHQDDLLKEALSEADWIIHSTPFGLKAPETTSPWPLSVVRKDAILVDMNYRLSKEPPFLEQLPHHKKRFDGQGMLVGQAVLAFELWTGVLPTLSEAAKWAGFKLAVI